MYYDFIEIGTSDFNTLIETASDNTVGISIEPIKHYLDKLPNRKKVIKVNKAIGPDGQLDIYYIPEALIVSNNLPYWLKGCNSVDDYHYQHINQNIQHLVQIETVDSISINTLVSTYDITEIQELKVDVEGKDCTLLLEFFPLIQAGLKVHNIVFENNILTNKQELYAVISKYSKLYTISTANIEKDIRMEYKKWL